VVVVVATDEVAVNLHEKQLNPFLW
jgi:hypothetical protein